MKPKINRFHGMHIVIAKKTGYSHNYVCDVINGKYAHRDTKATRAIKKECDKLMSTVNH